MKEGIEWLLGATLSCKLTDTILPGCACQPPRCPPVILAPWFWSPCLSIPILNKLTCVPHRICRHTVYDFWGLVITCIMDSPCFLLDHSLCEDMWPWPPVYSDHTRNRHQTIPKRGRMDSLPQNLDFGLRNWRSGRLLLIMNMEEKREMVCW